METYEKKAEKAISENRFWGIAYEIIEKKIIFSKI